MALSKLYLHHFRCYSDTSFEFSPGINAIYGANARGKTTILEAIHFLMTGRSFRTPHVKDLVQLTAPAFYLETTFQRHQVVQSLKIHGNEKERKILYNQTHFSSATSLLGILQGVVIAPDDVALVKGGPGLRRNFLDMQIAQVDPLYVHHLMRYNRAMRQRNALLRAGNTLTIESWEHEMAHSAAYLAQQRFKVVRELSKACTDLYQILSGEKESLHLQYKGQAPQMDDIAATRLYYMEQFQKQRKREMLLGYTLTGPHKDDLLIAIGDKEVRFFASEGQQRSCTAALRLAEWRCLNELTDEPPLMLIDDVGVSLDRSRRERLLELIQTMGQVFLTATDPLPIEAFTVFRG
ncbi:MAG: DNA replication/repair protein RecF [Parachlamydiaceae bacterium]|nr:DNA replication/repair protein RecF [Parachlamydiaceae bacterium]